MNIRFYFLCALLIAATPARAQSLTGVNASAPAATAQTTAAPATTGNEPLEVTADNSLEWKRNEKTFTASGHAVAKQGDVSVSAATLTAAYTEGEKSGMQINKIDADGTVEIKSRESSAFGQHATYDITTGQAVMTGDNLKLVTADQTVTAQQRFEYWAKEGKLLAIGNADVVRGVDRLQADQVSATMKDNPNGKRVLNALEATGNVIITTPTETARGAHAVYRADTNKAEISGNVKITRGPNTLEGERAEIDLNTNTSRIFGGAGTPGKSGQVRAVFYPGSEKKLEETRSLQ